MGAAAATPLKPKAASLNAAGTPWVACADRQREEGDKCGMRGERRAKVDPLLPSGQDHRERESMGEEPGFRARTRRIAMRREAQTKHDNEAEPARSNV